MPCHKSIFFSLFCSQGSNQVFSSLWFYVDGIPNPTRDFPFRFATLFLVPTVLCTRPHHHRPVRIPSPKQLPWPLVLYYVLTRTYCLPKPCIQQEDVKWFHLFCDILYSVCLEPILSLLSTILSIPFVLASSWLRMSFICVSFGSTRDKIRLLALGKIGFAVPLSFSFQFSWIPLLSANKSSLSATLVSVLFLRQSPLPQVLLISL